MVTTAGNIRKVNTSIVPKNARPAIQSKASPSISINQPRPQMEDGSSALNSHQVAVHSATNTASAPKIPNHSTPRSFGSVN